MGIRKYSTLLVATVSLTACGSGTVQDLNIQEWVGHSQYELVQSWGAPHHDYALADGRRAIGYLFTNRAIMSKQKVLFKMTNCMVNFEVDGNGTIEDAATTGKSCRIGPHDQMHPTTN